MTSRNQKPKSEYNVTPVYLRGDRRYVNHLKSLAASADITLSDYIRETLDLGIECRDADFLPSRGKDQSQSGNN